MRFRNLSPLDFYWLVFVAFALLFPMACYCVAMANVCGRRRPAMLSGMADFAGVLFANSGFLIVGGPLLLHGFHELRRRQSLSGSLSSIREALHQPTWPWIALWMGYFILIVGGSAWLLFRRRAVSVFYNIDRSDAQRIVPGALDRLQMEWHERGGGFAIEPAESGGAAALLRVTIVPSLRHMTVQWLSGASATRRRLTEELHRSAHRLVSPPNPVSAWLLTIATGLFGVLLVLLGLFVAIIWQAHG